MPATSVRETTNPTPRLRTSGDAPQAITAEEYLALPERTDGITYELVQGALVVREPPPFWGHSSVQLNLGGILRKWMEKFGRGGVGTEVGCLLSENPDTFRIPDVAVLLHSINPEKAFRQHVHGAPDIAIEVLSPSNDEKEIREKTADYFNAGALRMWIVDPETRTVAIRKADGSSTLFEEKDTLEDPEILPGFALEVQKVFKI